jgi:hypothetical protein
MTRAEVFEALLDCWAEGQRELAEQLLEDRHASDGELAQERDDWWRQWKGASLHPPAWKRTHDA